FHKERSDLDIGLKDGTDGSTYLALLQSHLPEIINKHEPDFAFYLSGVDVLATDKFGKLKLTINECAIRDRYVFETLKEKL
ncbi:histone deacetylase, partial [Klebsiella pneumoniae]